MTPSKVVKKLASLDTGLGEGRRTANDLSHYSIHFSHLRLLTLFGTSRIRVCNLGHDFYATNITWCDNTMEVKNSLESSIDKSCITLSS